MDFKIPSFYTFNLMIQNAIPILPTFNLKATIDFFENNLGFTAFNIGSCIMLRNSGAEIQLDYVWDKRKQATTCGSCCLYVSNIQDLYTRLSSRDMILAEGKLSESVFGVRQFSVKDNNGNTIYFREQKQPDLKCRE